jgi:hypothetical protein
MLGAALYGALDALWIGFVACLVVGEPATNPRRQRFEAGAESSHLAEPLKSRARCVLRGKFGRAIGRIGMAPGQV